MMKKIFILLFIFSSLSALNAHAYSSSSSSSFFIGFGNTTRNMHSAQTDGVGGRKYIEAGPTILAGTSFPFIFSGMNFNPAIGYSKYSTSDNTKTSEFVIQYHINQALFSNLNLIYGFSNYLTRISGDGGSTVLNNGNSTATFYVPSSTVTSYTASMDIGSEFIFTNEWSARLQFSIVRFLSSDRRRVNNLITVNYFF